MNESVIAEVEKSQSKCDICEKPLLSDYPYEVCKVCCEILRKSMAQPQHRLIVGG